MRKSKIILIVIIFLLLIILSIFTIIKINQYTTIINIANANLTKINSKKFYYEINNQKTNLTSKIWGKDSKMKLEQIYPNNNLVQTMYIDFSSNTSYILDEENKTYTVEENKTLLQPVFINAPNILDFSFGIIHNASFLDKINFIFSIENISSEKINNKDSIKVIFKLDNFTETTWFDSTTLYPIKSKSNLNDINATYNVTNCNLSNEEITFTDIQNYIKVQL